MLASLDRHVEPTELKGGGTHELIPVKTSLCLLEKSDWCRVEEFEKNLQRQLLGIINRRLGQSRLQLPNLASALMALVRGREQDDESGRESKRTKLDEPFAGPDDVLPPSHVLLGIPAPATDSGRLRISEADVGISEYIGQDDWRIAGIIKQRFTDFLVYEVDMEGNVIRLKSLAKPEPVNAPATPPNESEKDTAMEPPIDSPAETGDQPWPESYTTKLTPYFTEDSLLSLKEMLLQGPKPPQTKQGGEQSSADQSGNGQRGKGRKGKGKKVMDDRKVLSNPIASKPDRTSLHQLIREMFSGNFETETASQDGEDGSRVVVKWAGSGTRRGGTASRGSNHRGSFTSLPPYIHFTLQKTNRETQDALNHLARILHVSVKDLSVAGTKDKRGVTVQRVSLRRHAKTIEDVWRLANWQAQKDYEHALTQRADRGIRVADVDYRKGSLELGMLGGNSFIITLRNVKVDSVRTLENALNTVKTKGFINYYGMQRFGTASVPTHAIGLALLKSEWQRAIDLILRPRPGEHPDVLMARKVWLEEGDLDKAISLLPRRVVAERCILESYKKQGGDTRNAMGTFSTIPRTLRLMYLHAYQSYVWNAVVSERLRAYGCDRPAVGDLILEKSAEPEQDINIREEASETLPSSNRRQRSRKTWNQFKVKTLTEDDLDKYTIFDVVMPLPGTDVSYPGGELGQRYREFLMKDGLDPDNFVRKQHEYTLSGSYRKILHLPKEFSWTVLRYTDPDVSLAQADEDRLLGFDPPVLSTEGKFMALQIKLQLGTAAYATMALREITKADTSMHVQSELTFASEDQKYRGTHQQQAENAAEDVVIEDETDGEAVEPVAAEAEIIVDLPETV